MTPPAQYPGWVIQGGRWHGSDEAASRPGAERPARGDGTGTARVEADRSASSRSGGSSTTRYQPRKQFDDDELQALTESIKTHGVLQPLVVRAGGDGYQLIAGERRLRAAQAAGLTEVPVHVVDFDDQQVFEAALVENIQRSDLNPIEKAQGFKDYLDKFGLTQEQLGAKLGLDRTTISNLLGLLNLPQEVQDAVRLGQITLGHAKVLKGVPEPERQVALCKETILKNYSVHALELLVKQQRMEAARRDRGRGARTRAGREDRPRQGAGGRAAAAPRGEGRDQVKAKDKGQIVIGFDSNDDFERILEALQEVSQSQPRARDPTLRTARARSSPPCGNSPNPVGFPTTYPGGVIMRTRMFAVVGLAAILGIQRPRRWSSSSTPPPMGGSRCCSPVR